MEILIYLYIHKETGDKMVSLRPWTRKENAKWPKNWHEEVIKHAVSL